MIEDQRPRQPVLMNHTERRKSLRISIRRLAYINLEPYQAVPSPGTPDARSSANTQLSTGPDSTDDAAAGPKSPVASVASASQLPRCHDSGESQLMPTRATARPQ